MEDEYNWNLILAVSIPIAVLEAIIFYLSISNIWKWSSMLIALFLAGGIIYKKDRRKGNIYTAMGIVLLAGLVVKMLQNFGLF